MRYCIVDSEGKILNIVISDMAFGDDWIQDSESLGEIGGMYITGFFTPAPPKVLTMAEALGTVEDYLNEVASAHGYGTKQTEPIVSACSFAGYPNPFQLESQSFIKFRGDVWAKCHEILAEVAADPATAPETSEALTALLPVFTMLTGV